MAATKRLGLWQLLEEGETVGLDTAVFIYYVNRQRPYFGLCKQLLRALETGRLQGVISTVNEMEMLVQPLANSDMRMINEIESLLRRLRFLRVLSVDGTVARRAAALRASAKIPATDALIAASALVGGCRALLGNDREFAQRVMDINYLLLDDFV